MKNSSEMFQNLPVFFELHFQNTQVDYIVLLYLNKIIQCKEVPTTRVCIIEEMVPDPPIKDYFLSSQEDRCNPSE